MATRDTLDIINGDWVNPGKSGFEAFSEDPLGGVSAPAFTTGTAPYALMYNAREGELGSEQFAELEILTEHNLSLPNAATSLYYDWVYFGACINISPIADANAGYAYFSIAPASYYAAGSPLYYDLSVVPTGGGYESLGYGFLDVEDYFDDGVIPPGTKLRIERVGTTYYGMLYSPKRNIWYLIESGTNSTLSDGYPGVYLAEYDQDIPARIGNFYSGDLVREDTFVFDAAHPTAVNPARSVARDLTRGLAAPAGENGGLRTGGGIPDGGGGGNPDAQSFSFEDPADDSPFMVVSDGGKTITADSATGGFMWGESVASGGVGEIPNTGKHIFEIEVDVVDTWITVGITPVAETRDTGFAGQNNGSSILLWSGNARHYDGPNDNDFTTVTAPTFPSNGDLITVAVDMDAETISYYINGVAFISDAAWVKTSGTYQPFVKAFVANSVYKIPAVITHPVSGFTSVSDA